jgi:hypothetical protein
LDERPYADAEEGLTEVEQRGGKSKHFEADLYELLPSNDCIDPRYKKIINID